MASNTRKSVAPVVVAALLAAAAFAMWSGSPDREARDRQDVRAERAERARGGALASPAYVRATAGSVPPKFDFVEHWSAPLVARGLARGDFNGDGRDDLAALGSNPGETEYPARLHLFLQTPAGALAPAAPLDLPSVVPGTSVIGMSAADFNKDGRDDLVITAMADGIGLLTLVSLPGGGYQWRSDRWNDGIFSNAVPQVSDMDGDGHLDVVLSLLDYDRDVQDAYGSQLATWFGDGQGGFSRHAAIESDEYNPDLWLAQLDGVGPLDLLSVAYGSSPAPRVFRADGAGGWLAPTSLSADTSGGFFMAGSAFDVNADGRDDVVLSQAGPVPRLGIHLQLPDGSLSTQRTLVAGGAAGHLDRPVDLDGNGFMDLVQSGSEPGSPRLAYLMQDGFGLDYAVIQVAAAPGFPAGPMAIAIGDFNGDGVRDVALSGTEDGIRLWRGQLTPYQGAGSLPGAPIVVTALAHPDPREGRATVTVAAPVITGGSAVSGYTVYAEPGGGIDADAGSASLVHAMIGLKPGVEYRFRARATNEAGKGPPSDYAAPVTIPAFAPTLQLLAGSVSEPDTGDTTMVVGASLDYPAPAGGVSFTLSTQDGSAHAGSDYEALAPTDLHIPAGEWSAPAQEVIVHGDFDVEGAETFQLVASNVQGVAPVAPETARIYEDDTEELRLVSGVAQVLEADSGKSRFQVPLVLSKPSPTDLVVHLDTLEPWWTESATLAADYELPFTQIVIPAGQTLASAPIDIVGDTVLEHAEVVVVLASLVPFADASGFATSAFVVIDDNDPTPTLSLSGAPVQEGDDDVTLAHFPATLSATQPDDAWFSFETAGGTATPGSDFEEVRRSGLVIRAGQTELQIPVVVFGDRLAEGTEELAGRLVGPYGVQLGTATASASILDNDASTGISVTGVTQPEGNGANMARFVIELAAPQPGPVAFDVRTSDGTAFAGSDYVAVAMTDLELPPGQTRLVVDVPVLGDTLPEPSEAFGLEITRVEGATPVRARALARLVNDDMPTISISDATVVEGTGANGKRTMNFTVSLSSPAAQPVTFWLTVQPDGSATPWADMAIYYQAPAFDPGRTRQSVELDVYADDIAEPEESFEVVISAAHGAIIGDAIGIGTIIDDDQ